MIKKSAFPREAGPLIRSYELAKAHLRPRGCKHFVMKKIIQAEGKRQK